MQPRDFDLQLNWFNAGDFEVQPSIWPEEYANGVNEFEQASSPVPFMRVYGDFGVGKSTFASLIHAARPGTRPTTLYFDLEHGNTSRARQTSMEYVNLVEVAERLMPAGYRGKDIFELWWYIMDRIPRGYFSVVVIDPISELEQGLREWVNDNFREFGRTPTEYAKNGASYWDDVKTLLKHILSHTAARVQTVVGISHLRLAWEGSAPSKSGRKEPKGLRVWDELSSISLWLYKEGGRPVPAGKVDKCRLDWLDFDHVDEFGTPTVRPMLPPNMPVCTPSEIKRLMATPVAEFSAEQRRAVDPGAATITDDERALLRLDLLEKEAQAREDADKQAIIAMLIERGAYKDVAEIGAAVRKHGLAYSRETREQFIAELIAVSENGSQE